MVRASNLRFTYSHGKVVHIHVLFTNWYRRKLDTPRDALAACPWTCSFSWCLAEGYGNGDQRRPTGPCGSGRTVAFLTEQCPSCDKYVM